MGHHYDNEPRELSRHEQRMHFPDEPKHRARRDTRRWCRGKPGIEHTPAIVLPDNLYSRWRGQACRWMWWGRPGHEFAMYRCHHRWQCTTCGRKLRDMRPDECPSYMPKPAKPRVTR